MGYGSGDVAGSGELAFLDRLRERRPRMDVIVDVGANVGEWSRSAHERWPSATIHAFEPAETTYAALVEAVAGLPVHPVRAALSSETGEAVLHAVPGLPGLSSLHYRDLAAHDLDMTDEETVSRLRLDDFAAREGIDRIDLLKIDVEGHELEVLMGASGLLSSNAVEVVQFEFGGTCLDSRVFLRDILTALGPRYDVYRMLLDDLVPLKWSEYEELFVTSNFVAVLRPA